MKKALLALLGLVVVVAIGAGSWVAFADSGDTTARGTCEGKGYELSVEDDDGGLELSYELQSSGPGEVWQIAVQQGGTTLLEGERTTDADGELDLDTPAADSGSDEFTVTATPTAGGAACTATLTR